MPQDVSDVGSNLQENLQRWSAALSRGGNKLKVFNVVYSIKTHEWTAKEISDALNGAIEAYRVTDVARQLVGEGLLEQVPGRFPVVYKKIQRVQHYKDEILRLAKNAAKRKNLSTKRNPRHSVKVSVSISGRKQGRALPIAIDEIDQFSRVRKFKGGMKLVKPLPESKFKRGMLQLLGEKGTFKDSGVELNDIFTGQVRVGGKRHVFAFALKGPGQKAKVVTPGRWGSQGTQIQRLTSTPATGFMLQAEKQIDQYSIDQLERLVEHKALQKRRDFFYGFIERNDSLRLRKAYPKAFRR